MELKYPQFLQFFLLFEGVRVIFYVFRILSFLIFVVSLPLCDIFEPMLIFCIFFTFCVLPGLLVEISIYLNLSIDSFPISYLVVILIIYHLVLRPYGFIVFSRNIQDSSNRFLLFLSSSWSKISTVYSFSVSLLIP